MSAPVTSGMLSQRTFGRDRTPRATRGGRHRLGLVAAGATLVATAPLSAIFHGWAWLFQCAVAVAAIAAAAAGARTLRAPMWAQILAMGGALLLALTWLFPSGDELLGILPSPATLTHFGVLFNQLPGDVQNNAIPVPDLPSLLLVTVLGVGLVAIAIDLFTVTLRRPALAGLPMLAIYSVPVAVMFRSVSPLAFAIGVVGYLWLLGTDNLDRVRRFGRRFTGDGRDVDVWEPSPLAAAGRRLAVIGVLVAVMVPLAVPGITSGLVDRLGSGFRGMEGSGGGQGTEVNLFAALNGLLNRDETNEMLEVTTDDPDPHYLRLGVADVITAEGFDNQRPRGERANEGLPPLPARPGVTRRDHQAEVRILPGFTMGRLPTYPELRDIAGVNDAWRYDANQMAVFSGDEQSTGQAYLFAYGRPEFDPDTLRRAEPLPADHDLQQLAQIPPELREPEVSQLVADLTEGLDNPYDQVRAINAYFTVANGFSYSLETGDATTGSAIVDFLIVNQRGYCVQYAAAMAWMVREIGLPSRVVIGFTSGRNRTDGSFTLTNHNAHAWPEVYFQGVGWVPFEPTPSSRIAGSVATPWAPDPNSQDDAPEDPTGTQPSTAPGQEGPLGQDDPSLQDGGEAFGGGSGSDQDNTRVLLLALAGAVLVIALLAAPALTRARLRQRRLRRRSASGPEVAAAPADEIPPGVVAAESPDPSARARAHAAWDELLDTMTDFRVPLDPTETPRMTSSRLVKQCRLYSSRGPGTDGAGTAADGARLLGYAEERARYARTPLPPTGLLGALRAVRRALADRASRWERVRAALLPPSTLLRWRLRITDAATTAASVANRWAELMGRLSPRRLLRSSQS